MIVSEEHGEFALAHLDAEFAQPMICQLRGALLEEPLSRERPTDLKHEITPFKTHRTHVHVLVMLPQVALHRTRLLPGTRWGIWSDSGLG